MRTITGITISIFLSDEEDEINEIIGIEEDRIPTRFEDRVFYCIDSIGPSDLGENISILYSAGASFLVNMSLEDLEIKIHQTINMAKYMN